MTGVRLVRGAATKAVKIVTRTGRRKDAHRFQLIIDTQKNQPRVSVDRVVKWPVHHGTRVEIELEGNYRGGQHSVDSYIRQISLANPHARIVYQPPTLLGDKGDNAKKGNGKALEIEFPRVW